MGIYESQSLNSKKFDIEDLKKAIKEALYEGHLWTLDENRKSILKSDDRINFILNKVKQPKVFDVEIEVEEITENVINFKGYPEKKHYKPKITNDSIKVIKVL